MIVDVEKVSKSYGVVPALCEATCTIANGEWVGFCGPSGSGKTTLLRLIAGFDLPDTGRILLDGVPMNDGNYSSPPHERRIGFVFQNPTLWPHLTVWHHLTFAARNHTAETLLILERLLEETGLSALRNRFPAELSGGQARRVALARALAATPRLLLLDEPFSNLDAAARNELLAVTQRETTRLAATVIFVTHHQEEIIGKVNRTLYINQGQLSASQE